MDLGGSKYTYMKDVPAPEAVLPECTLVGASSLFQQVLRIVDAVASNDCVVLLEGESGTGKELIARRIHANSARSNNPFIPVNCPAITETLFESQFYGHVKGAFTGAATSSLGVVRAADGGTLMLDEVGELPFHLQPKLLRLLQEHEVTPVGASRPISVDVRFIAATNRSLAKSVVEGAFRSDLYHRLNIVRIEVPPLRARPEDIDSLLDYYIEFFSIQYVRPKVLIGQQVRETLKRYPWPGNVRELCGYIERLYAAGIPPMAPGGTMWNDGYISAATTPMPLTAPERMPLNAPTPACWSLVEVERHAILRALEATRFNRTAAARLLQVHRSTLIRKMRVLGLEDQGLV